MVDLRPYQLLEETIRSTDLVDQIEELRLLDPAERSDTDGQWLALANEIVSQLSEEDLRWGVTLIADSAFRDHAIDSAYECGLVPDDSKWPLTCIDWDRAARELQVDYTAVEVAGRTYWYLPER